MGSELPPFAVRKQRTAAARPALDLIERDHDNAHSEEGTAGTLALTGSVGPYQIVGPLGMGAYGIVHHAVHDVSQQHVALKTVRISAPLWLESIRREIRALTRIAHPGIVRIVDHGIHGGRPWYAMELLEGETFRALCQRLWSPYRASASQGNVAERLTATEPLEAVGEDLRTNEAPQPSPPDESAPPTAAAGQLMTILKIVRRLCVTLAFLHGEGFVNCDLKPENVLLVNDWPVIIDFGLTMRHPGSRSREAIESRHALAGTLPYASPEQIRGEFVDARSDLYSLGCILYELVVGAPPFSGTSRSLVTQHLTTDPVPPSRRVKDVPPALDSLILKLLAKDLNDRFGYAEEVAALLAAISGDTRELPEVPPARAYLYRPRFVGRAEVFAQVAAIRDRAIAGRGAFILVGGESGVGKTRFAMEVTRLSPGTRLEIVSSEAAPFATDAPDTIARPPLHTVRPLLQAVADYCQSGGRELTERLFGPRQSVLAHYEPLIADLPSAEGAAPVVPLDADASRQRLFRYLAQTLAAFAREQPVLWILDDLTWADELSLAFLQSLSPDYFETNRVLILGTHRTEEPAPAVETLSRLPHVINVALPRLEKVAVRSMIGDMLAWLEPSEDFVRFVIAESEGNPFFVAEWLRAAVGQGILHRDQKHMWQLVGGTHEGRDYGTLPLPRSLRELIEHRLKDLSTPAREAVWATAVLGRSASRDMIRQVAGLGDDPSADAFDELLRRHVLEHSEISDVRFAHDKLREVSYAQAPPDLVVQMHDRAGAALERQWSGHADASQIWPTLGHHFAVARRHDRAAKYLRFAAQHASSTYANGEAIVLCQEALNQVRSSIVASPDQRAEGEHALAQLHELLADVLHLTGRRAEARDAYQAALDELGEAPTHDRARLFRKMGKGWEMDHEYQTALAHYGRAEQALPSNLDAAGAADTNEWINIMIDQLWVHYWLNQVPDMNRISRRLRPVVERHGSPSQTGRFFDTQMKRNLRLDRFSIREETLEYARAAVRACEVPEGLADLPMQKFNLGFTLLFQRSLAAAHRELAAGLALAERSGDIGVQVRCLTYLAVGARMQRNVSETRRRNQAATDGARIGKMQEYIAAARATESWLSLREDRLEDARVHAESALAVWAKLALVFPFQWLAALPLLEVSLATGDLDRAAASAALLVSGTQQWLPGPTMDALKRGRDAFTRGDAREARAAFERALLTLKDSEFH